MKKVFGILFLTFGVSGLFASSLEVGLGSVKFDYNEYKDDGTWLDSETSSYNIDGGFIQYDYDLGIFKDDDRKYDQKLELKYSFHLNTTNYDGSLLNGTPYKTTTDNYLHQGHIRYKASNKIDTNEIGVFVGLGYRYWDRDILGAAGYLETYEWPYYEAGLSWKWYDGDYFVGIEASYQKAYNPKMYAYLSGGLDFDLGDTKGYKYSIPLGYKINNNWNITLEYTYDEWNIEKSNVVRGFYEPSSETKNRYTYLSLEYKF